MIAGYYDEGLILQDRCNTMESWLRGKLYVAFWMGVDKGDVKLVVLWDVPDEVHEHVQEVGRAGRDGGSAVCILLLTKHL
jgi:ATP-dependent DNA helicase RecQ